MWMGLNCYTNVYIRPHLEFCVQVRSSYFKKDIDCMEKVQRMATQMIYGSVNLKYEEILEKLVSCNQNIKFYK